MKLVAAALHAGPRRASRRSRSSAPPSEGLGFSDGMFGATDFHDLVHKTNDSQTKDSAVAEPGSAGPGGARAPERHDQDRGPCDRARDPERGRRQPPARPHAGRVHEPDRLRRSLARAPALVHDRQRRRLLQDRALDHVSARTVDPTATWRTNGRPTQRPLRFGRAGDGDRRPTRSARPRCAPDRSPRCAREPLAACLRAGSGRRSSRLHARSH